MMYHQEFMLSDCPGSQVLEVAKKYSATTEIGGAEGINENFQFKTVIRY